MTNRRSVLLSCLLLLLPGAVAAAPHGVQSSFAIPAAQSAPAGQSGEGEPDAVDRGQTRVVAVVPFANISRDVADDWIGHGIAETIVADLETLGGIVVIGRDAVAAALGDGVPASEAAAVARLGSDLGAGWLVTGGYQRSGQQLRITTRLVDARTGEVVEAFTTDGGADEIFVLQDRVVQGLMAALTASTTLPTSTPTRATTESGSISTPPSATASMVAGSNRSHGNVATSAGGALARGGRGPISGGIVLPADDAARSGRDPDTAGSAGGDTGTRGAAPVVAAVSAGILTGRPSVTARRTNEPPTIDGLLDDAIWQRATRITEFV